MFKYFVIFGLVVPLSCTVALASSTSQRKVTVNGTVDFEVGKNDVGPDGQCNVAEWVNQCPSGNCACVQVIDTSSSGNLFGRAKIAAKNFFITIDLGLNPATAPVIGSGPEPEFCGLVYGVMTVSSNNGAEETFNALGTVCDQITGISKKKPEGTGEKLVLSGIGGISDTPAPNPPASGFGTFSAQVTITKAKTYAASLTLTGLLTQ
jgi:hypothetical protein